MGTSPGQRVGELNQDSFYINVDISPDIIEEYRIQRKLDTNEDDEVHYQVLQKDSSDIISQDDTFKKVSKRVYEAKLKGETRRFKVPLEDLTPLLSQCNDNWTAVSHFPDGHVLGDQHGSIHVYDQHWQLQKVMNQAHVSEITSLQTFPSGTVLLSAASDMQIKLWSLLDGSNPRTFVGHTASITQTVLVGRGRNFLSSGLDGSIRLWECGSGKNIHTMRRRDNPYDAVNSMTLFDKEDRSVIKKYEGQEEENKLHKLEFETKGKQIIAGHKSGVITLHDVYTKQEQLLLPNEFMSACNVVVNNCNKENYVYAGYENGTIAQWDIRSPRKSLSDIQLEGTLNPVNTMHFSTLYDSSSLFVSAGLDTSFQIQLNPDYTLPSQPIPTFLVSDDYKVSQFLSIQSPYNDSTTSDIILAVGNRGFISMY